MMHKQITAVALGSLVSVLGMSFAFAATTAPAVPAPAVPTTTTVSTDSAQNMKGKKMKESHVKKAKEVKEMKAETTAAVKKAMHKGKHGKGTKKMSATDTMPATAPATTKTTTGKTYSCADFTTKAEAQKMFDSMGGASSDAVKGMDGDKDGKVCESLK
jgi:outer membrane biosynthesis protein TonB